MRFWNERGRQLRRPYFKINHKAAPAVVGINSTASFSKGAHADCADNRASSWTATIPPLGDGLQTGGT